MIASTVRIADFMVAEQDYYTDSVVNIEVSNFSSVVKPCQSAYEVTALHDVGRASAQQTHSVLGHMTFIHQSNISPTSVHDEDSLRITWAGPLGHLLHNK